MKHTLQQEIELGTKSAALKLNIIRYYINNGENTLAELGREMFLSVPTVTKLVGELMEDGFVVDFGKQETSGGRRPNIYGVNPDSGYFMGIDMKFNSINIALINFNGHVVASSMDIPFKKENTPENLDEFCGIINDFIGSLTVPREKIMSAAINISGRVNTETGHSYSFYFFNERPLSEIFHEKLGIPVTIDNDSRAMCYGEYMSGVVKGEKNVVFINCSWGLGVGLITDGKLYYGRSGFSGEFGHTSAFENEIMCHCGKKGCLETEASASAVYRKLMEKIAEGNSTILQKKLNKNEDITVEDIIDATLKGDMLAIELVEEAGNTLGKHISWLINLLNPELVVIGGTLSLTGDYLLLPVKSAIRKYALNLISKDTTIKLSKLGENAGVIGACMLARKKMLNLA